LNSKQSAVKNFIVKAAAGKNSKTSRGEKQETFGQGVKNTKRLGKREKNFFHGEKNFTKQPTKCCNGWHPRGSPVQRL